MDVAAVAAMVDVAGVAANAHGQHGDDNDALRNDGDDVLKTVVRVGVADAVVLAGVAEVV